MKPTEEWLQEQLAGYGTYQITTKVLPGKELNCLLLFRKQIFFCREIRKDSAWQGCLYEPGHYVKEKAAIIFCGS
jgi:hypothetical protein